MKGGYMEAEAPREDRLFLDIENDGDRLLLNGWARNDGPVVSLSGDKSSEDWGQFTALLASPEVTKVTQGDHDLRWFKMRNYQVEGPWENTMVMAWILDENQPLDLESLTRKYTPKRFKQKAITQRGGRLFFGRWALDEYDSWLPAVKWQFQQYNIKDVETLRDLHGVLLRALAASEWKEYWEDDEVPYSRVLLDMECRGLPINLSDTAALAREVRALRDTSAQRLRSMAALPPNFNLNSPDHLRLYLFTRLYPMPDRLPIGMDPLPSDQDFEVKSVGRDYIHGQWICKGRGLEPTPPPRKKGQDTESTKPSTEAKELLYKHGTDEWVREYCLEYKRHDKLLGTYLDKFPRIAVEDTKHWHYIIGQDGEPVGKAWDTRIFGRFNQTGTVTGRLSSSDPNLQNIPARREMGKRVRGLFQGRFVIGDYDALEMRLMAHFSRDPRLLRVFEEGGDPHLLTARAIFGGDFDHDSPEREVAKTVNYGTQYGGGARTLAMALTLAGFPTKQGVAKEYIETLAKFYPRLTNWKNRVIWTAKDLGYVETIGGRLRRLPQGAEATWKSGAYAERQAVNSLVQGSAADILRRVMLRVDKAYPELRMLAQIHDEIIWEYGDAFFDDTVWCATTAMTYLEALQVDCQTGHGFDLRVPLVFEPKVCERWSDK